MKIDLVLNIDDVEGRREGDVEEICWKEAVNEDEVRLGGAETEGFASSGEDCSEVEPGIRFFSGGNCPPIRGVHFRNRKGHSPNRAEKLKVHDFHYAPSRPYGGA